LINQINVV